LRRGSAGGREARLGERGEPRWVRTGQAVEGPWQRVQKGLGNLELGEAACSMQQMVVWEVGGQEEDAEVEAKQDR